MTSANNADLLVVGASFAAVACAIEAAAAARIVYFHRRGLLSTTVWKDLLRR